MKPMLKILKINSIKEKKKLFKLQINKNKFILCKKICTKFMFHIKTQDV